MEYRIEHDSLGEVKVAADKLWGAQTQRSLENFKIGIEKIPMEVIYALVEIKRAAAASNHEVGLLDETVAKGILLAADEVLEGKWDDQFPLSVWQTGSGTQSNMNVNEVLANRGNQLVDGGIHPNDHVNKGQSSNDTFPAAMHIAGVLYIKNKLYLAIEQLIGTLTRLEQENAAIVKLGRTHLQDATPLTLGQEISAWRVMLEETMSMIEDSLKYMRQVALGGTAVGTGLNADPVFIQKTIEKVAERTGEAFVGAENKFHALTSKDAFVHTHGAVKALAANFYKIANDVRWLASGPRSGIGEISIPMNEPGSSIMPGKVNPTQSEAVTMACIQVMGNDSAIGFAASQGSFQLNTYMPLIVNSFMQSVRLLADALISFDENCASGIKAEQDKINYNLTNSLMLVTALNPYIGYEKAAKIAQKAFVDGTSLKEAAVAMGHVTAEEFDKYVDPMKMV
ncbi:class II fumarate hydratase [Trichococcus shcherbakoviae]|uniref:Fumarate hydratase class II n=1 Tax=Trichococcus shcherbakoviae subsp. psychrophilus TaxID=2585775 RepID=A0A5C5E8E1_9LACT|nr:class II fumarate hydratase [Trichococcus shcherbakoviae]TNV68805.1 class II fumarate hydratase [Trichococcus shcherbakoviae subsp. psychrophilus]